MKFKERVKNELRITCISFIVSLLITILPAIFLTIINVPLAYLLIVIFVTILIRREVIKVELKVKWNNGGSKK